MKNRIFILLSLIATLAACQKDEPEILDENKPSIHALVLDMDKNPVAGAEVIIVDPEKVDVSDPLTYGTRKQTNSEGVVTFSVESGMYGITAYKETVGSAGTVLEINDTNAHNIELILMPEDFVNYPPQIQQVVPAESSVKVSSLDKVNLSLMITDDHSDYSNLHVTVACETDGILYDGIPTSANTVDIEVANLSKGYHNLRITATDEHNAKMESDFYIDVSIVVPVELSAEKANRQVVLNWTDVLEPDFEKLVIERSDPNVSGAPFEVIATITDKTITSFTDTLPPIAEYLDYRVKVYAPNFLQSEPSTARVELPMGIYFNLGYYSITHAVLHPNKDWVYLNVNDDANKIIIYDFTNEQVVKEIPLDYEPRYPVIADNGSGLQVFVPGDNNAINIYSADANFSLIKTINTLEDVNNVVPNGNGILIAGMDNYYYNYRNYHLRTFSQETGQVLDSIGDRSGKARIVADPLNPNRVYGFEASSSNYARLKSEIDSNGKFISYELANTYDYRINSRTLYAMPTGDYFIIDYAVFSTADFSSGIDLGNSVNTGITYNNEASLIYTCNRNNNRIYTYSANFEPVSELETRTTPGKLLYRNNKLITLGYESGKYIIVVREVNN